MFSQGDFSGLNGIVTDGSAFVGAQMIDLDGDGISDMEFEAIDTDGDGLVDAYASTFAEDSDGDGFIDTLTTEIDFDMDGIPDALTTASDIDSDGELDVFSEVFTMDADGDGTVDSIVFNSDTNMDGVFDTVGFIDNSGNISFFDSITDMQNEVYLTPDSDIYTDIQNFEPDSSNPDLVVGNPADAMESFHVQSGMTTCAVAAQEFVLEQLLGVDFSEDALCEMASAMNWYDPEIGTLPANLGNILAEHGLSIRRDTGNSIQDIETVLENGGGVIVGVDSYELYDGSNDFFAPGDGANHAVQVIGIDKSDPLNPMVILNDSGVPNGGGALVSMENFTAAWEDSGYLMVEAYV